MILPWLLPIIMAFGMSTFMIGQSCLSFILWLSFFFFYRCAEIQLEYFDSPREAIQSISRSTIDKISSFFQHYGSILLETCPNETMKFLSSSVDLQQLRKRWMHNLEKVL
jgi:hypothetical protein